LREAIAASGAGDTIDFAPNLNGGAINLVNANGELVIGRDLTVVGPAGGLTINGPGSYLHRLLRVSGGSVSLFNFTFTGGYQLAPDGVSGTPSVVNGGTGGYGYGGGIVNSSMAL
jgi:hypothetical protein